MPQRLTKNTQPCMGTWQQLTLFDTALVSLPRPMGVSARTVFCWTPMVDVGLNATLMTMSSPLDNPPCTPPLRLVRVRTCRNVRRGIELSYRGSWCSMSCRQTALTALVTAVEGLSIPHQVCCKQFPLHTPLLGPETNEKTRNQEHLSAGWTCALTSCCPQPYTLECTVHLTHLPICCHVELVIVL
jgi:hypothetical protein